MTKQQREALKLGKANGSQKTETAILEKPQPAKVEETPAENLEEKTSELLENQTREITNELKQEEKPAENLEEINKVFTLENTIDVVMNLGKKIRQTQKLHIEHDLLKEFIQKHNGDATGHDLKISDGSGNNYQVLEPSIIAACLELIKEKQLKTIETLEAEIKLPIF